MLPLFAMVASAQDSSVDKIKPQWLHKPPTPTNPSFKYKIVSASATSEDEARDKCFTELVSSSGLSQGIVVSSEYNSNDSVWQMVENGKLTEKVFFDSKTKTFAKSKESMIYVEKINEYKTQDKSGEYHISILYAISELGKAPLFDNVEVTDMHGTNGLWRSAIVPGWGQFYKGSNLKGGLILGGTVALVGGIIFTENQRMDYVNKIAKTHDTNIKRTYATKRDHFATGRNICVGAVAALYVYNLIDAIAAPGARRVIVHQRPNGNTYAISPSIMADGNPAMTASITF